MNDPLVTTIIPAYNAGKDLPGALESLERQTLPTRIVIANDGSTDTTAELAENAARTKNIQVIHLPNSGANAARKAALKLVKTPFVAFLDADDAFEPCFIEKMLATATTFNADVVFCPYTCIYNGVEGHISYAGEGLEFAQQSYPIRMNPDLLMSIPVFFWGKLFRTEHVKAHLDFASRDCAPVEDIPTIIPFLINTPQLAKVSEPLYRYTIAPDSICRTSRQELFRLNAMRCLHKKLESIGALPDFMPQLKTINRIYLFDQLEKLCGYYDPIHQHRVIIEYFRHLNCTLGQWRPHPFHPTFYAAYWHTLVLWNSLRTKMS